jgi:hypothetical protein
VRKDGNHEVGIIPSNHYKDRPTVARSSAGGCTRGAGRTSPSSHWRSTRECEAGSTTPAAGKPVCGFSRHLSS